MGAGVGFPEPEWSSVSSQTRSSALIPITEVGGSAFHSPGGSKPSLLVTSSEPSSWLGPRPACWGLAPALCGLPDSKSPHSAPQGTFHTLPVLAPSAA